ncbi:tetratricopeptide repeat protein [Caballeronia sp. LZ032]|uniref:tetratricopeptide repeat protein n=1 Tax=Caballeronia sp. LZ032 TaxID=3038565 RepID=UPI002857DA2E|nr:hypothetical protein [Caballeronia sp. LZ032]MDR5884096.1 hypothetical protein [Caballeronia sp. LZ032]
MAEIFPDRREQIFGRTRDIRRLRYNGTRRGITAVVGRPLMGKTWTLTEVARTLIDEDQFLVGYHESKGSETSHLLYAVSDLYARWLADATMREQAISLWERHSSELVPRIGKMVGLLFEKLAPKGGPEGVASIVRAAFDGLAEAQKDLLSGGVQLAPLPYEEAFALTELVAKMSGRRIALFLDAWEKSPSVRFEHATLEAFLKHIEHWPHVHIFVAIRYPDLNSSREPEAAYRYASDLCRIDRAALLFPLDVIDPSTQEERNRLISFVKRQLPAAAPETEQRIFELIDGYPGVLSFWSSEAKHGTIRTREDLRLIARDAQELRYIELERLLSKLPDRSSKALALRIAFFQRLESETWELFRGILLAGHEGSTVNELIDLGVLADERFPTYGHDTRSAAAQQWFIRNQLPAFRRASEEVIEATASCITGVQAHDEPFLEALIHCLPSAREIGVNARCVCLIDAARTTSGDFEGVNDEKFDGSYTKAIRANVSISPLIAMALINRGMNRAELGDNNGAINDFSSAIDLPALPVRQSAIARYNRACLEDSEGNIHQAIGDFTVVAEDPDTPAELRALALHNRGHAKGRLHDDEGAVADYSAVIELAGAPVEQVTQALINRGIRKRNGGEPNPAIVDFSSAIEVIDAPAPQMAMALFERATTKQQIGDYADALRDFTATIDLADAPLVQVAKALVGRAAMFASRGAHDKAIADYTAIIELPGAPGEKVARAYQGRGTSKAHLGDSKGAVQDLSSAIALPGATKDVRIQCYTNRGTVKARNRHLRDAIEDFSAAIDLIDVRDATSANPIFARGVAKWELGDFQGARDDFDTLRASPDAPEHLLLLASRILESRD